LEDELCKKVVRASLQMLGNALPHFNVGLSHLIGQDIGMRMLYIYSMLTSPSPFHKITNSFQPPRQPWPFYDYILIYIHLLTNCLRDELAVLYSGIHFHV